MQRIVNDIKSTGLKVAEYITPILKESKFREAGVLTPEEFVAAGDHLVHQCPSWQWASSGDESWAKEYLPKDKQFLITRKVPCKKRCRQMDDHELVQEKLVEVDDSFGSGDWVDTHHYAVTAVTAMSLGGGGDDEKIDANKDDQHNEMDDGPAIDMEAFEDSGMFDDATVATKASANKKREEEEEEGDILSTRTYDLNITYDKYYQTPRLWLIGYNENNKTLTVDEMYEDFSADHANKTITIETHPHQPGPPQASVHPCRHAHVMKKLIDLIVEGGKNELQVHMYMIVFLKFVQAIIPTIEYDFTKNVSL